MLACSGIHIIFTLEIKIITSVHFKDFTSRVQKPQEEIVNMLSSKQASYEKYQMPGVTDYNKKL